MNIKVKIQYLSSTAGQPQYATSGSLAVDLVAFIDEALVIEPNKTEFIATGIAVQIPSGFGGFVFARSGLASKNGITLVNGVGVIDADYTGEIKVPLINLSDEKYVITPGDRIAQMVFLPVVVAEFVTVEKLNTTCRGNEGFGSTGK